MNHSALFEGFLLTITLITAIGAQNAFVLKQGIKRQHQLLTAITAILFDIPLLALGVFGFGFLFEESPELMVYLRVFGGCFLVVYAYQSFRSASKPKGYDFDLQGPAPSRLTTLLMLALFTFLNPHTYLDTIVLIGGTGAQYERFEQMLFVFGATAASSIWFFSLTYGAGKLSHYFQKAKTWQILDRVIGVLMLVLSYSILSPLFV